MAQTTQAVKPQAKKSSAAKHAANLAAALEIRQIAPKLKSKKRSEQLDAAPVATIPAVLHKARKKAKLSAAGGKVNAHQAKTNALPKKSQQSQFKLKSTQSADQHNADPLIHLTRPAQVPATKRKRKLSAAEEMALPPEERARRQRQRELREAALRLRAHGKEYKAVRNKNKLRKTDSGTGVKPAAKKPKAAKEREFVDDTGSRPEQAVQLIIVPIYWNKKPEEKAEVLRVASRVEQMVSELGATTGLDTTNKLTPGQKFRFWEERGVKVRIELGPRDAQAQQVVLARSASPGAIAQRATVPIGPALRSSLREALGLPVPAGQAENEEAMDEGVAAAEDAMPSAAPAAAGGKVGLGSGDDLGDDFGLEEEEEPAASSKAKKAKKKSKAGARADAGGPPLQKKLKKQKPHKVVKL